MKTEMAKEINVFDSEEFERLVSEKDIRISNALVDTVLKNLKGKKNYISGQIDTLYKIRR